MNEKQKLFTRHSIGTRIAALFMLLILVITFRTSSSTTAQSRPICRRRTSTG